MVVVIFVALMITLVGITCAWIGYEFGVRQCTKKLEKALEEVQEEAERDFPEDYNYGY